MDLPSLDSVNKCPGPGTLGLAIWVGRTNSDPESRLTLHRQLGTSITHEVAPREVSSFIFRRESGFLSMIVRHRPTRPDSDPGLPGRELGQNAVVDNSTAGLGASQDWSTGAPFRPSRGGRRFDGSPPWRCRQNQMAKIQSQNDHYSRGLCFVQSTEDYGDLACLQSQGSSVKSVLCWKRS